MAHFMHCLVVVGLLALVAATNGFVQQNGCQAVLDQVEPKLRAAMGEFWFDFDALTININAENWTAAQVLANVTALVDNYFTSDISFGLFFGATHPSNVNVSGRQAMINWIVYSASTLSGGENHVFGFPRFKCSDMNHYTVIVPAQVVSRAKALYPKMNTVLLSTIRMDFMRTHILSPWKISRLFTEGQEGYAATINGNPKWNPVTNTF